RWFIELIAFQFTLIGLFQGFASHFNISLHLPILIIFAVFTLFFCRIIQAKDNGLLSATLDKLFDSDEHDSVIIMSDAYARGISVIAFSFTLLLLMLITFSALQSYCEMPLLFGSNLTNVSFFLVVAWVCVSKQYRKTLRILDNYLPLTLTAIIIALAILAVYFAVDYAAHLLPQANPIQLEHCQHWNKQHYAMLMSDMFNLSWILIYVGYLAQLSQGYNRQTVMLASLVTPLLATIMPLPQTPWFTMLCASYLLVILLRKKQATHIMRATLPYKQSIKKRKTNLFIGSIMAYTSMLFAIYCITNVFFIGFVVTVFVTPVMLLIFVAVFSPPRY
ncbi:MAG: hypothetical protein KDH94_08250, partial [Coxiellaceae bacterium]|nr:hypothetical protein [Coxiellaceae bacterium]